MFSRPSPQKATLESKSIERRNLLIGGGAALGLLASDVVSARAHDDEPRSHSKTPPIVLSGDRDIAPGVIESIDTPGRLELRWDTHLTEIEFTPDALFWRGKVVNLSEFRLGDNVVAEGTFEDGRFTANNLSIVLHSAEGAVSKFQSDRFSLGDWLVLLTAETKWLDSDGIAQIESPKHLVDGVHLSVTGCREPEQSTLLASLVQLSH